MVPSSSPSLQLELGCEEGTNPGPGRLHAVWVKGRGRSVDVEQGGGRSLGASQASAPGSVFRLIEFVLSSS